jgi:hypothetical protein
VNPLQIFRDTVSPQRMAIDDTYQGVIAYADGRYAWPTAQISRFTAAGKHLYRYDVTGDSPHLASVLDVERYDATPGQAAVWVPERNRIDNDAACYTSLDNVPELLAAIGGEPCWLIVADWTGRPHVPGLTLPPNVRLAAVQYATTPSFDLIAVYSGAWLAGHRV